MDYGIFVLVGFAVVMLALTLWARWRNFGNKEGTPSASHNSDYAAALSDLEAFIVNCEVYLPQDEFDELQSIYQRLNSAKAPNCA